MDDQHFDYIIVGGGSAGCVLANRLSAGRASVLLLEAGGHDRHPLIHMPVGFARMTTGPFTWGLATTPQKHANGREIPYTQARVLGGGSSINAEIFTRGHPNDFDRWAEAGCTGWSFADVQPYFLKSEGNTALAGPFHGTDGPLGVSDTADPQPITRAFVQACQELGMPLARDFAGDPQAQAGCGIYQTTTRNGWRCSAVVAYLRPTMQRPNLQVQSNCLVERINLDGTKATGVAYRQGARRMCAHADIEVIITAGAIGTPKLLMLSGIGPAVHLRETDVKVVVDLPGVGANLTDHFGVDIVAELEGPLSLDKYRKWHWSLWAGLQYLAFRTGPVTSNVVEGGAFWFAEADGGIPDLQFHFLPAAGAEAGVPGVPRGESGITLNSYTLRPKSRGSVRLRSADPLDTAMVDPGFLADPEDLRIAIAGVRISQAIFDQAPLRRHIRRLRFPDARLTDDDALGAYVRAHGRTSYHPCSTCRMGVDETAVVTPELQVHGVQRLRICDSSVMPTLIGSNTNATTVMIAEKAADLIACT